MQKNEDTTNMPRRVSNMMARAITQVARGYEARGRNGQDFVKPGQVVVEVRSKRPKKKTSH